jgi:hypothetical protein
MENGEPSNTTTDNIVMQQYYSNTEWCKFYSNYKEFNQGQLQKKLLQNENEIKILKASNDKKIIKCIQHIFYKTHYNEKLNYYETPFAILECGSHHSVIECKKIKNLYLKRNQDEYNEVKQYYENRKEILEAEHKEKHNANAKQTINCPVCNSLVTKRHISRHLKTNKQCLEIAKSNST